MVSGYRDDRIVMLNNCSRQVLRTCCRLRECCREEQCECHDFGKNLKHALARLRWDFGGAHSSATHRHESGTWFAYQHCRRKHNSKLIS
jgi:hypothetical protein